MKQKLIINADDLGFTLGINHAILEAHNKGFLTHASLMANTQYFQHAIEKVIPNTKNLKVGLHVNLTCEKPLTSGYFLAKNGIIQSSFMQLLLLRKTQKVLFAIENEIEAQLVKIKENNINITHIDGHEHVHIIPSINKIVRKLAKKYEIERVREINENLSWNLLKNAPFINLIKYFLLRFLSVFNNNDHNVSFYSILHTCQVNGEDLFRFLEKRKEKNTIEIMLHPSIISYDKEIKGLDKRFIHFFSSKFRTQEYELCFNKNFKNYVIQD